MTMDYLLDTSLNRILFIRVVGLYTTRKKRGGVSEFMRQEVSTRSVAHSSYFCDAISVFLFKDKPTPVHQSQPPDCNGNKQARIHRLDAERIEV